MFIKCLRPVLETQNLSLATWGAVGLGWQPHTSAGGVGDLPAASHVASWVFYHCGLYCGAGKECAFCTGCPTPLWVRASLPSPGMAVSGQSSAILQFLLLAEEAAR